MSAYPKLCELDSHLKSFLSAFLIVLALGVTVGIIYITTASGKSTSEIAEHYRGSDLLPGSEDIPEHYPKPMSELLITIHGHAISFSLIFFCLGGVFFFNSVVSGKWKFFCLVEPFVSIVVTFGGMWALRFVHPGFVYVMGVSSILMYGLFYFMVVVCLWELWFKPRLG